MKKISVKNLDSLGIEKLSRKKLKNTEGGNDPLCLDILCPPEMVCFAGVCGNPNCDGVPPDLIVCCSATGARDTCLNLSGNCGGIIVSVSDERCP